MVYSSYVYFKQYKLRLHNQAMDSTYNRKVLDRPFRCRVPDLTVVLTQLCSQPRHVSFSLQRSENTGRDCFLHMDHLVYRRDTLLRLQINRTSIRQLQKQIWPYLRMQISHLIEIYLKQWNFKRTVKITKINYFIIHLRRIIVNSIVRNLIIIKNSFHTALGKISI